MLGKKSTPKIEIGDFVFANDIFQVYSDAKLSKNSFKTTKGQDLGIINEITSSYIGVDFQDPYEDSVKRYLKKSANYRFGFNPDFEYPDSTNGNVDNNKVVSKSGTGFWDVLKESLGLGAAILNSSNKKTDSSSDAGGSSDKGGGDKSGAGDTPNNQNNTTKTWYIVAGIIVLLVILVLIFWKPNPPASLPQSMGQMQYVSPNNGQAQMPILNNR